MLRSNVSFPHNATFHRVPLANVKVTVMSTACESFFLLDIDLNLTKTTDASIKRNLKSVKFMESEACDITVNFFQA